MSSLFGGRYGTFGVDGDGLEYLSVCWRLRGTYFFHTMNNQTRDERPLLTIYNEVNNFQLHKGN